MTNSFKHISLFSMVVVTALTAAQAYAQAPTNAQRSAIKSSCRSDYMAHCSSVTPGGAEALQCLQKNMSGLSSACQSAVRAVTAATEPKSETKPAATEAGKPAEAAPAAAETAAPTEPAKPSAAASKPASSAAAMPAGKPSKAQVAAIRSACRSDYPSVCAGVAPGGAAALQCLEKNKAKLSPACEKAVAAASGGAAAPAAAAAAPAAGGAPAPAAPVLVLRPLRPLEELRIVNAACGPDARALCSAVQPGGGRIARCLATNAASLSPACRSMLAEFAAR